MFHPSPAERASFETLPFEAAGSSATFPEMDVDRFAAFVAQMEAKGAPADVLARHGIHSASSLLALQAEHERRFARDASLRSRFEERKAHFLRFMRK